MVVERVRARGLTVVEQVRRDPVNMKKALAVRVVDPGSGHIVKVVNLFAQPVEVRKLIPASQVEVRTPLGVLMDPAAILLTPEEIDAKAAVIDALFEVASVRKAKVDIPEMIDDSRLPFRVVKGVVIGSLAKGRKIAAEINEQNPGRKLRVPTEAELLKLNGLLGAQLEGIDFWIWTETEHEDYAGRFVLRLLFFGNRGCRHPEFDYNGSGAVRFVEDK